MPAPVLVIASLALAASTHHPTLAAPTASTHPTLALPLTASTPSTHPTLALPLTASTASTHLPLTASTASTLTHRPPLAALAPSGPKHEPPPPLLQPTDASAAARAAYAAGDYISAARQYEALARDTAAPRYLFNAGMAREAAGELSHAVLHWQRYLSSGTATTADRELLTSKLAAASTALVRRRFQPAPEISSVELHRGTHDPLALSPSELDAVMLEAGEWTAHIHAPGPSLLLAFTVTGPDAPFVVLPAPRAAPPPLPSLSPTGSLTLHLDPPRALRRGVTIALKSDAETRQKTLQATTTTWQLPRGLWTVIATAPDREAAQQTVTVDEQPHHLDFQLRLSPTVRRQRILVPAIVGAAGLGLTIGGLALAVRSSRHDLTCLDATTCQTAVNAVHDRSSGLALIGTGLGTLIPAATAAAGARTRALVAEAGIGAAVFTGGLAWYLAEALGTTGLEHRPQKYAAATMLGLGAGLVGSAVLQLIVRRAVRDRRTTPHVHARSRHVSF